MEAAEAFEIALQYVVFGHELGEANHNKIQFWIGTSYVLLIAAYAAPQRMTLGVSALLLTLYIAFTSYSATVIVFDDQTANAALRDAHRIAEMGRIEVESVTEKLRGQYDEDLRAWSGISALFAPGLFFGVIGFVSFVAYKNFRDRPSPNDDSDRLL